MDKIVIIKEMLSYMRANGGPDKSWYVGISQDARKRLFTDHNVSKDQGIWIDLTADTASIAREVEDFFINQVKTDGGAGSGDIAANKVYAYKKTPSTRQ
jgi:hypothetical protein